MAQRNRTGRDQDYGETMQEEQFQDSSGGRQVDYDERERWEDDDEQMDDMNRRPTNFYYEEVVLIPRRSRQGPNDRNRNRGQSRSYNYDRDDDNDYDYGRGGGQYRSRGRSQPGTHQSFRGDSYGGEAMTGPAPSVGSRPYHEESGFAAGGWGYSDRDRGGYGNERGFFDRAGDEIASWFGDEEAERRREMDYRRRHNYRGENHSGKGPSNYTRSDERILEDACDRLADDHGIDASNISVTSENGELTLDGTVNTRWEKRRAEDCVHNVSGISHVQNNLRIKQTELRAEGNSPGETAKR